MDNISRITKLPENKYQMLFGVHKPTFDAMLAILESAYKEMRKRGGRKRKLSVLDMLVIMLGYYHDYRTMENIAFDYGVHKQRICEAIVWVEDTLLKEGTFSLPSKRELLKPNTDIEIIIRPVLKLSHTILPTLLGHSQRFCKNRNSAAVAQKFAYANYVLKDWFNMVSGQV